MGISGRTMRLLVGTTVLVTACNTGGATPTATPKASGPAATTAPAAATSAGTGTAEFKLRGANAVGPNTSFGRAYETFADCLSTRTNGRVELEIFHSATLGSDAEALELAQTGALDFTETTIYSNVIKVGTVFDLPYLFNDEEHWKKVTQGAPGQVIKDAGIPSGIRILSFHLGGWRDTYGNKKISSAEDLKGMKLRTLQSPAYVQFFQALGAVPTPLAFGEVYLALQQGTLDGAETALPSMYDAKHYEVSKYVAQTHHGLSSVAWVIAEATWKKLPADIQGVVVACDKEATDQQITEQIADATRIDKELQEEKGIEFTKPDLEPLRAIARDKVYTSLITEEGQKALLQQVIDLGK
ncbi:MAG: TRAP transporter substrate-binding protein [Chloroflexi bacterium]|nr:TRAP transporter substrate-binding protein [Chloroflexota bacterium]